jgi:myo-inositol 2-dehydrogenase/D-chiro-inositol 1-dehydrogenase
MRREKTVRIGLIGAGGMGLRHAVNIQQCIGTANVTALCDPNKAQVEKLSILCGDPTVFEDPVDLVQADCVDAVIVAAPDPFHAQLVMNCLNAGKPVLCEKPLSVDVEDAVRILEAENSLGRRLISVGFNRRFDAFHTAVKKTCDSGVAGSPLLWKGSHRNASAMYNTSGAFILINSAGHDIDSARWLLASDVKDVFVLGLRSRKELPDSAQDLLLLQMTMQNGCLATAEVYVNADYGYEVSAEVVCQRGTVTTGQPDLALLRAQNRRSTALTSDFRVYYQASYVAEITEWITSIQCDRTFGGACAWDGYAAVAVSNAAVQSLENHTPVAVEPIKKPALYEDTIKMEGGLLHNGSQFRQGK